MAPVLLRQQNRIWAVPQKWRKEADPDDLPPKWMAALGSLSALKAVGAGAVYVLVSVKQWVFTLSAIGVIGETELVGAAGAGMYLLFVLATQILVLPPIVVVVSLVFGIWFLFKGISGLVS